MRPDPLHQESRIAEARRHIQGRVLAAVAVQRRLPTFEDLAVDRRLHGIGRDELARALDALVERGMLKVERYPSASTATPLFEAPAVHYRSVAVAALSQEGR